MGALALGRLQTAFGEVEHWQRIYLALAGTTPNTDWQDAVFDRGAIQDHNLSVSGGTPTASYLISGGFRELLLPIAAYLGIPKDRVFANRMHWQWDDETGMPTKLVSTYI